MNPDPPLLIIAPMADACNLARLPWCEAAREKISVNRAKFENLDMVEVIVDAMPFLLSRLTAAETAQQLAATKNEPHFCDLPTPIHSAIGITLRDNLTSARQLPEVNQRLLLLGKWIGESLNATATAWMPSRKMVHFTDFDEIVRQYLADGHFPALFQTSFSEVDSGHFVTSGLHYFTGQEIRLTAPPDYSLSDISKFLMHIIDAIATHGKIDSSARSNGLNKGETLIYKPSEDLKYVDITIERDAMNSVPPNN